MFELTIDSLSYFGGRGVGRFEGVVVFVPGTAPGDRARVRITASKPRFVEAEVVELLQPGPSRRQPPCPVANRCGGCSWQHITYPEQIKQKDKILRDSLRKLEKLGWVEVRDLIPAPEEFHYRNRIQLQIRDGKSGFFAKRTRDLVPVETCWIAEPALNERMRALTPEDKKTGRLELAVSASGEVLAMAAGRDPEAALFSQVNRRQNEQLLTRVLQAVHLKPEWIMDLYSGSGNITMPLAEAYPNIDVLAVELSRASVERGRKQTGSRRIQWEAGDVAVVLVRTPKRQGEGLVVLDPPRSGCEPSVIDAVVKHAPKQIIYVSCNPTTFARDAERLVASARYELAHVQGLDMFPQTEHLELVATFRAAT